MTTDITPVFAEYFAQNLGPAFEKPTERKVPNYEVTANIDGNSISLSLGFRKGSAYCCYEPGCHFLLTAQKWKRIRQRLERNGAISAEPLSIHLHVVVEEGSFFFDYSRPRTDLDQRGWYEFSPAMRTEFDVEYIESQVDDV